MTAAAARMVMVALWLTSSYGLVLIVTGSKLFEPLRRTTARLSPGLGYLLRCPMCFGFWVGLLLSLRYDLGLASLVLELRASSIERAVLDGAATTAICWHQHVLLAHLGAEEL